MIKQLQKIGNSRGLVLDKALLKLLKIEGDGSVEIVPRKDGLLIRRVDAASAYETVSKRHRRSLNKLGK
jgi:antitoxin component of MazEF toxin-antitoxin module